MNDAGGSRFPRRGFIARGISQRLHDTRYLAAFSNHPASHAFSLSSSTPASFSALTRLRYRPSSGILRYTCMQGGQWHTIVLIPPLQSLHLGPAFGPPGQSLSIHDQHVAISVDPFLFSFRFLYFARSYMIPLRMPPLLAWAGARGRYTFPEACSEGSIQVSCCWTSPWSLTGAMAATRAP